MKTKLSWNESRLMHPEFTNIHYMPTNNIRKLSLRNLSCQEYCDNIYKWLWNTIAANILLYIYIYYHVLETPLFYFCMFHANFSLFATIYTETRRATNWNAHLKCQKEAIYLNIFTVRITIVIPVKIILMYINNMFFFGKYENG